MAVLPLDGLAKAGNFRSAAQHFSGSILQPVGIAVLAYLGIAKEAEIELLVHLQEVGLAANCRYDDYNSLLALEFLNRPNLNRVVIFAKYLANPQYLIKCKRCEVFCFLF